MLNRVAIRPGPEKARQMSECDARELKAKELSAA